MAEADANSTRGELLVEAFKTYVAGSGGHIALAKYRLRADIVTGRVTMSGENKDGSFFELPPGCSWGEAAYDFHGSAAGWLVGSKPIRANLLAGKVAPADTRRKVVAYVVRVSRPSLQASVAALVGGLAQFARKNLGGRPEEWNWSKLKDGLPQIVAEKGPFNDEPAFVDWCGLNVERADGMKRKKDPDTRSVQSAIRKHKLDQVPGLFKPSDRSAQ